MLEHKVDVWAQRIGFYPACVSMLDKILFVSSMRPFLKSLLIVSCLPLFAGCGDGVSDHNGHGTDGSTSGNYFAVVGYYNDGEKQYKNLGVSKLDECRARAIAEYNSINAQNPGRAFDWFCKNTHSGRIDR